MTANQQELAKILGISARRVRQLRDEYGLFASDDSGARSGRSKVTYTLEKCVPEYIRFREGVVSKGDEIINKEKEQAEHERVKKELSIEKLKRVRHQTHEASDVEHFLTDMLVDFRIRLLSIPHKVAPVLVAEDDINVILSVLEKATGDALDALIEYDPLLIDKEPSVEQILEDVDADNPGAS